MKALEVIAQKIAGQAVVKFELGTCHEGEAQYSYEPVTGPSPKFAPHRICFT